MSPPAPTELRWFGPFEVLHALELPQTTATDLYEGYYAGFYDDFTREEQWDVARYVEEARAAGGPVLELACGSGRLALPLARAGIEVHGLDLSKDMLRVLAKRAAAEPDEVRARLKAGAADVTSFDLGRSFELIVLGATSICLLHDPAQRVAMFEAVKRHLAPGGRFLFDFTHTSPEILALQDAELLTLPGVGGRMKRFTLLGRRWLPEDGVQLVNFYSEVVDEEGATRRFLGSTAKGVMEQEQLLGELSAAGLALEGVETVLPPEGPAGDEIRLVAARHP